MDYCLLLGPVSPPEAMEDLDLSKSTAYDYIDRLVDPGSSTVTIRLVHNSSLQSQLFTLSRTPRQ